MEKKLQKEKRREISEMRRFPAFLILILILVPSFILMETPSVKADGGQAKVYIICLPDVGGWTMGHSYDPTKTKEGVIKALNFKESIHLPWAHPKLGKAPPFYGISYEVVTSWDQYKTIIEFDKEIVLINTHGERTPIPSGYPRDEWADKIAEAMLKRRVTWVHTAGYPFFFSWHQDTGLQEWNANGFQRLMSNINKGDVTCWPPDSEKIWLSGEAKYTLLDAWGEIYDAYWAERGRPLKGSDFKNYTVLPIWGTVDGYMTGAVIAFAKPSERVAPEERYGFGGYVHLGTDKTYKYDKETPSDDPHYSRGYVAAAAAIWTETEAFRPVSRKGVTTHVIQRITEWGLLVTPGITMYGEAAGPWFRVDLSFGIYGCMKTNHTEGIEQIEFYLEPPSGCTVWMWQNVSVNGYHENKPTLSGLAFKAGRTVLKTIMLILAAARPESAAVAAIGATLGGFMLYSNWIDLLTTGAVTDSRKGVEGHDPYVEFIYVPEVNYSYIDGYKCGEFESIIHIELLVNMENRPQWTTIPLSWYIGIDDWYGSRVHRASGGISIALFNPDYDPSINFTPTVFFEDFEDDMEGWSVGDANSLAGYDYWGTSDYRGIYAHRIYCAQVGDNSIHGMPNREVELGPLVWGAYDKYMNSYLTRSVDLRPYQSATLRYYLTYLVESGDYLAVEYYESGLWNVAKNHNSTSPTSPDYYYETSLPTTATRIRFRFYSNDDNYVTQGAFIDNIEIRATLPNDADNGQDAGDDFDTATLITISSSLTNYAGYLNNDEDWYKFPITSLDISDNKMIYVSLRPPSNTVFRLELRDPDNSIKASSYDSISYILSSSDQPGNWSIGIYPIRGFGQYDFDIRLKPRYSLTVKTYAIGGSQITNVKVWIDGTRYYSPVTVRVLEGSHTVKAQYSFTRWMGTTRIEYTFDHWEGDDINGETSSSVTVYVTEDVTIRAYYEFEVIPCPTLFVWNGSAYVYETLLDIHGDSDITLQHQIEQPLVKEGRFYRLSLRELDDFTSHIDQVRLYAVDSEGETHLCPLAKAVHNELGKVTKQLMFDDETRVDLQPTQTIDLKFIYHNEDTAYFIFEINGHNRKIIP